MLHVSGCLWHTCSRHLEMMASIFLMHMVIHRTSCLKDSLVRMARIHAMSLASLKEWIKVMMFKEHLARTGHSLSSTCLATRGCQQDMQGNSCTHGLTTTPTQTHTVKRSRARTHTHTQTETQTHRRTDTQGHRDKQRHTEVCICMCIYIYAAGCLIEPYFLTLFSRNLRKRSAKMNFFIQKGPPKKCSV